MSLPMKLAASLVGVYAATVPIASDATEACRPSDIQIIQAGDISRVAGYVHTVGELRNNCPVAIGVRIQVTFRNADGRVVLVANFWPNSSNNIRPGDSIAFQWSEPDPGGITSVTAKVLSVNQWNR